MKTDLTLVLLTHERSAFMDRALSYYECFGCQILVADSSQQSAAEGMGKYSNVNYCHLPGTTFLEKIKTVVKRVETPLMVFMSDDDFVLLPALESSAEFLMKHQEYVVCHGYCMMYLPEAQRVHYFYRDKKVCEDYCSDNPRERLSYYLDEYLPPFYAVVRTSTLQEWYSLVPDDTGLEYQEVGHVFYLLYAGKARILPIPYIVRETNVQSEHGTDMYRALVSMDSGFVEMRRNFIKFASEMFANMDGETVLQARRFVEDCLSIAANCLASRRSLTLEEIFASEWQALADRPKWSFQPTQFVEMPFYNSDFFSRLEGIDFLLRTTPIGQVQKQQLASTLQELEGVVTEVKNTPSEEGLRGLLGKLDVAFNKYPFHLDVAAALRDVMLLAAPDHKLFGPIDQWVRRIEDAAALAVRPAPASEKTVSPLSRINRNASADIEAWLAARTLSDMQRYRVEERLKEYRGGPEFLIVLDAGAASDEEVRLTLDSLSSDVHLLLNIRILLVTKTERASITDGRVTTVIAERGSCAQVLNERLPSLGTQWVLLVQPGEEFTANGLLITALELLDVEGVNAVSADEIWRLPDGGLGGAFRPAFNLDYLISFPAAMARHWFFRSDALLDLGGLDVSSAMALELDALLRLTERHGLAGLGHVSEALMIARAPELANVPDEQQVILASLRRRGYPEANIEAAKPGRYKINYGHSVKPLVSIIIPTKNQIAMLRRCVETLLEVTAYSNYELMIVDNGSDDPEAVNWLRQIDDVGGEKIKVISYNQPFNFSTMNNVAARDARGEYLVLLNNDTAVLEPRWLDELLNHAMRPEVGVVGAKLLYPDGRIQHAGVILGLKGPADHVFIGELSSSPGYMHRLEVDQNFSAVTAACLMVKKSLYEEVGGMDEVGFKVSYNDVDLCLKIKEAGYLIVWASHAVLLHEGSVSQKKVDTAAQAKKRERFVAEQDRMFDKWLPLLARDPAYNSNLSLVKGTGFFLADNQISWKPLESWRPAPVVLAHPADHFGCGHYRIIQPFNALKQSGSIEGALSAGLMHVADFERYSPDVVILQRQISEERLEAMRRMKRFSNAFKVYELDDYLPNLPIKSIHRDKMPKDVIKSLSRGLSFVDRFVVSTQPLAEAFADYHSDIRVVENRLDPRWWKDLPQSLRSQSSKPRVGWAGGSSHTGDLELIFDVVKELASEVEWVFFGMCPEKLRPYIQEFHPGVPIAQYPAKLASLNLDLALAPVEQNFFNECKSNLRLLEYGICGYPVICSDVRCYAGDLPVTRVKNRFKDWVEAIRTHIADSNASEQKGLALRNKVLQEWMLEGENLVAWRNAWLPDS